jgi:hypothetical protein
VGDAPLAMRFPRLFNICTNKNIFVAHVLPVSPSSLLFGIPLALRIWSFGFLWYLRLVQFRCLSSLTRCPGVWKATASFRCLSLS